ncbi:dynamin family protein [Haloglycomyces albus]|uniref:dynamin family protein n=1 Tax=Haloglycomyces albus TaxID=526067 RepID=UPI00046D22F7|nr:dynamin family protein [Haloglycomyces albus]
MSGSLAMKLKQAAEAVSGSLTPESKSVADEVAQRLSQPLTVAVAGRLSSGKSTLVNALIGQRVAPTAAGECTRVVTRFRYGPADRIEVVTKSGERTPVLFDADHMIPASLPCPVEEVDMVDVQLASQVLENLVVLDTPGLQSVNSEVSDKAADTLFAAPFSASTDEGSKGAVAAAEAIIYVFTQAVKSDDVEALEAFSAASHAVSGTPMNSLALFNKVDKLAADAGSDPWPVATPLADEQLTLLRRVVCDVVPLVGLLAETSQAGLLTAADGEALRTLAGMDETQLTVMLASTELFHTQPAPVDGEVRRRLLDRLDLYGISFAIAQLRSQPRMSTGELVRLLQAASGLPRLHSTLHQVFASRADVIKAGWGLSRLRSHAAQAQESDRDLLHNLVEDIVADPAYHRLKVLQAAGQVTSGQVRLEPDMEAEAARLALSQDPATVLGMPSAGTQDLAEAAIKAAGRWRAFANGAASPPQARVAQEMVRGFSLIARQLRSADNQ